MGIGRGTYAIRRSDPAKDVRDVADYRETTDAQMVADLLIGLPDGEKLQNFYLTDGEAVGIARQSLPVSPGTRAPRPADVSRFDV